MRASPPRAAALDRELKLSLAPRGLGRVLRLLGLRAADGKARRVWLLERPGRPLARDGVVLRLRASGKKGDATVKLRPVSLDRLRGSWARAGALELEVDVVGGRGLPSAALERELPKATVAAALRPGRAALAFSPLQRRLVTEVGGVALDWTALRPTRPAQVTRWKARAPFAAEPLVLERWRLPGGRSALELSTTVPPSRAVPARRELEAFLRGTGVARAARQASKAQALLSAGRAR